MKTECNSNQIKFQEIDKTTIRTMKDYVLLNYMSGVEKEIICQLKQLPRVIEVNGICSKYIFLSKFVN